MKSLKVGKILLFLLIMFFVFSSAILVQIFFDINNRQFLKVVFLDVGQGDAIFIETPSGQQTIIDAGPNSDVVRSLSKFIPYYDKKIDLLIATHSDSDHVAGFVDLMERFNINFYSRNSFADDDSLNTEIAKLIDENKIDLVILNSGDRIIIDNKENIYLDIIWPPKDHLENDNNDNSIVARLTYGDISFLFTGDASIEIEDKIISVLKDKIKSQVLKLGHHGSKTSTGVDFLKVVDPVYGIISAGKDNRFGHPNQEVVNILEDQKIKILETSVLGSIHFETDGSKVWLVD